MKYRVINKNTQEDITNQYNWVVKPDGNLLIYDWDGKLINNPDTIYLLEQQKCKYLDELGLKLKQYGTNFTDINEKRNVKWKEQCEEYGFDERETWNLDRIFIEWIYTRFKMYKELSIVDTSFHKISYKDKEITQKEGIDKVLNLAKEILQSEDIGFNKETNKIIYENSREICEILKELLPFMWW